MLFVFLLLIRNNLINAAFTHASLTISNRTVNFYKSIIVLLSSRNIQFMNRPDSTSTKTFASGAGGMGFKSRADKISHALPAARHRCNLDNVSLGAKPRRWAPLTRDTRKDIKRE